MLWITCASKAFVWCIAGRHTGHSMARSRSRGRRSGAQWPAPQRTAPTTASFLSGRRSPRPSSGRLCVCRCRPAGASCISTCIWTHLAMRARARLRGREDNVEADPPLLDALARIGRAHPAVNMARLARRSAETPGAPPQTQQLDKPAVRTAAAPSSPPQAPSPLRVASSAFTQAATCAAAVNAPLLHTFSPASSRRQPRAR